MRVIERVEALRRLPWYSVSPPPDVPSGRGMIHDDERRMLYTLARDYFTGDGRIIDGGTFLGSSSLALGCGLRDRDYHMGSVIDAYDHFVIDDFSVMHHLDLSDKLSQGVRAGDSVRFIYDRNIAPVANYIVVHEGDLTTKTWEGGPIEILFSDVSKSLCLNDYIIRNWISHLLPESGILIQQDQVQQYHVWVSITMEMLADYFEMLDYTLNSSMVYRLERDIPAHALERALSDNVSVADMEYFYKSFLERFRRIRMGRYTGWSLGMVELGLAVVYGFHIGDRDQARHALDQIEKKFFSIADTMARLSEIRGYLDTHTPCPGSRLYW